MSNSLSLNDLAGGSKSWTPEELGDRIEGTITSVKRVQQTDFTTGSPLEWNDGSPRMQTVVELQTNESTSGDDDGIRAIWLKGGRNFEAAEGEGVSGEVALAEAAKAAGAGSIDEGAKLTFVMTGRSKPTTRGYQPAKLYRAKYQAPVASIALTDLYDD
ncbi:hypothetical protein [Ilumatobacter sp.]|uniref:hypothetical protein n=1 Tax=Ilumatobacter sp. TaxID=1967498 RepID=UPI00374FF21A